jgi:putative RNA 2'-phosphotransferase
MKTDEKLSKELSYILRHRPDSVGVSLDSAGWCSVSTLLVQMNAHGTTIDIEDLKRVVANDSKGRYSLDGERIRANQGHSVKVDLGYKAKKPPVVLYHGTVSQFLDAIMKSGLKKMKRHHVHLSADEATANMVGSRRGKAVILLVDSGKMDRDGYEFFLSDNGVWLTDSVPAKYISKKSEISS